MKQKAASLIFLAFCAVCMMLNPGFAFSQEQEAAPAEESTSSGEDLQLAPTGLQENPEQTGPNPDSLSGADEDTLIYYIRVIDFNIVGRTRAFALLNVLDMKEGDRVTGKHSLETLIRRKTQLLRNERVLEDEECRIDYTIGEAGEDGIFPVDLLVHVKDAWNFIILPEPKFDSNDGFSITLKGRDYNFLGTMKSLPVNLGWKLDDGQHSVSLDVDADIPFRFLGLTWTFNFDNTFNYFQVDPSYYKNVTGISVALPWRETTFTFGFDQSFILNEENGDVEQDETGVDFFEDKWYMTSELYAKWAIPVGVEVGDFGDLTYTPKLTETFAYRPGGDIGDYRTGSATGLSHSLGFGQTNWVGNFRKGLSADISNSYSFNNYAGTVGSIGLGFSTEGHLPLTRFLGISGRLEFSQTFDPSGNNKDIRDYSAGSKLRGIRNNELIANSMLSFNLELPLRILTFKPSQWFNTRSFRPIDVEVQLSPFVDMAMFDGETRSGEKISFGELIASGGVEVIVFSLPWRSLYLRASLGWDLREWHRAGKMPKGRYRELFLGLGHFF